MGGTPTPTSNLFSHAHAHITEILISAFSFSKMMSTNYDQSKEEALNKIIQSKIHKGVKYVIIDGFDGEGKSTYAKKLATVVGWKYVHYPLTTMKYESVWMYLLEMLETYHVIDNSIVDRYVFSTIAYNNIKEHTWAIKFMLQSIAQEGFVILGGYFADLITYKLSVYPELFEIYNRIPKLTVHPWLFREPNYEETIAHMSDQVSIDWVRSTVMPDE